MIAPNSSRPRLLLLSLFDIITLLLLLKPCHGFWSTPSSASSPDAAVVEKHNDEDHRQLDIPVKYGVDVSFPIHHIALSTNYAWLPHNLDSSKPVPKQYQDMAIQPLGNRQKFYDDFINGCIKHYGSRGDACRSTERDRVAMSLRQPQSMVNYTDIGFKKVKAPDSLMKLLIEFWETNKGKEREEMWGPGNTYVNNWESKTYMVSVEDSNLRGGGYVLKQKIWDAAHDVIADWTQQELTPCSLYGIRVYKTGALLATHVDRLPLVSSAIINVAQDVDEPWPLEVIGHDGVAYNVTLEPGDMALYESHSVLHGRPFPLKGRFMANVFIHFEPTGHSLRHHNLSFGDIDVDKKYKTDSTRGISGHENEHTGLPPYIIPGTPEESNWRNQHPEGFHHEERPNAFTTGSTEAHLAAQEGRLRDLEKVIQQKKDIVHAKDENGWTPLHEGVRGGHLEVVKFLIENGADKDATTNNGGGTPLYWAKKEHSQDHPVVEFLESIGAADIGPEL